MSFQRFLTCAELRRARLRCRSQQESSSVHSNVLWPSVRGYAGWFWPWGLHQYISAWSKLSGIAVSDGNNKCRMNALQAFYEAFQRSEAYKWRNIYCLIQFEIVVIKVVILIISCKQFFTSNNGNLIRKRKFLVRFAASTLVALLLD